MNEEVILKIENVSKQYRLGLIGTGTISHDLNRLWAKLRGNDDPYLKVGAINDRSSKETSGYVWALKDINIDVTKGEVLGIIGKNGAGKSTLLKILSKVTGPTVGQVKSNGRIASLLEVGTGFHPEMTGKENIFLNGAILGMTKSEISSKLEEIISFSGCEKYIDTPVKRYSSGMKVRLAFAVAAHLEPDILVVDEVLAVGDVEFQKKAIGKMQDISKTDGRTVLFVSHDIGAVRSLCTSAVVLDKGMIAFRGTADQAVDYYVKSSKDAYVGVKNRTDRKGNGAIQVVDIKFRNHNEESVDEILSGDELRIDIKLKKKGGIDFSRLVTTLVFKDPYEKIVLSFVSSEMGTDFSSLATNNNIQLKIPNFYIRANRYSLQLSLSEGTPAKDNFYDRIENAANIRVLRSDLWNVGTLSRSGSYAILPGEFIVNEDL